MVALGLKSKVFALYQFPVCAHRIGFNRIKKKTIISNFTDFLVSLNDISWEALERGH